MKLRLALILCMMGNIVQAQSNSINLALPNSSQSYQSDKFRAGDLDCSNAIGSATNLEFGVTGLINDGNLSDEKDVGVFARITIPLGKTAKNRIDCNKLYELELQKKRLEVMKLEAELRELRSLQFEE